MRRSLPEKLQVSFMRLS